MENYIALLLLIVPGFISMNVFERLTYKSNDDNQFIITIHALIFSIFITLCNYIVMALSDVVNKSDVFTLAQNFSKINFVIGYTLSTIIISIFVGYLWSILKPRCLNIINKIRLLYGKNKRLNSSSIMGSTIDDGFNHLVKVEKNGVYVGTGFLNKFNIVGNTLTEISITEIEDIANFKELKEKQICTSGEYKLTEYIIDKKNSNRKKRGNIKKIAKIIGMNVAVLFITIIIIIGISFLFF